MTHLGVKHKVGVTKVRPEISLLGDRLQLGRLYPRLDLSMPDSTVDMPEAGSFCEVEIWQKDSRQLVSEFDND